MVLKLEGQVRMLQMPFISFAAAWVGRNPSFCGARAGTRAGGRSGYNTLDLGRVLRKGRAFTYGHLESIVRVDGP